MQTSKEGFIHTSMHYDDGGSDESSKEGFKYGSIQVTTEQDQSYVLVSSYMDGVMQHPHCMS